MQSNGFSINDATVAQIHDVTDFAGNRKIGEGTLGIETHYRGVTIVIHCTALVKNVLPVHIDLFHQ